jgi:hypothetical protein
MIAGLAVLPADAAQPDPVFAAIERYKAQSVEYIAVVDWWTYLEPDHPDYADYEDDNSRDSDAFFDQMGILFNFRPSTVAGVAALLKYISALEDWQMLAGLEDSHGKDSAQALCASLAAALEQIGGAA